MNRQESNLMVPDLFSPKRRSLLRGLGGAALTLPLGLAGREVLAAEPALDKVHPLTIAWSATSICTTAVPAALKRGIFEKHNLDVSFVNFAGSTDQLLEAIATRKADAGVGMAFRWIKPLEQGFDVKLVAGLHGGCMRLLASDAGLKDLIQLKGKTIGVSDMASPSRNFFSVLLAQQGFDPEKDVEWRAYPADLLGEALKKGEVQAIADNDPAIWMLKKNYKLNEISSNLCGSYADRSCCVLAVAGDIVRKQRPVATALVRALQESAEWVANNSQEAAEIFASYAPKIGVTDLTAMLQSHTHHHHPTGDALRQEIAGYATDLKLVHVLNDSTDPQKFVQRVYSDVLA